MTVFYRRMPRFGYLRPTSLQQALDALDPEFPTKDQVFAGGTDLLLKLKSREIKAPKRIIDLKGIPDLDHVAWNPETGLRIGALATIAAVGKSPLVRERFRALAEGANIIASDQIQNRGTIVGNVCNAVNCADSIPPLLVHDAKVICVSRAGERAVALTDFICGPGEVALRTGELVQEIRVPPPLPGERSAYLKLAPRGRMDLSVVGAAASLLMNGPTVAEVRIGLGSAAPTQIRALETEALLRGKPLTAQAIAAAAHHAAQNSTPRSSQRASAEYRRMMVEVLVRRVLTKIAGDIAGLEKEAA